MDIKYKCISSQGEREINEDSIGVLKKENCVFFSLADGLGGHGLGDEASKKAVETSLITFKSYSAVPKLILDECFSRAQNEILKVQEYFGKPESIKTTLVNLFIDSNMAYWGHIGDSRLYFFRKNKLVFRTSDHSVPQMLYKLGDIKEKDIRFHIDRNKLLRVLGVKWDKPKYEIDKEPLTLRNKDAFLLCSDGFWEWIDEKEMIKLLRKARTVNQWLDLMQKSVEEAGKSKNMDNYSAIAVFVE